MNREFGPAFQQSEKVSNVLAGLFPVQKSEQLSAKWTTSGGIETHSPSFIRYAAVSSGAIQPFASKDLVACFTGSPALLHLYDVVGL